MKRLSAAIVLSVVLVTTLLASERIISVRMPYDSLKKEIIKADTSSFAIPNGITAGKIIENYINAIGGKAKLEKVLDRTTVMKSNVNNKFLTITIYQKVPDKMRQIIDLGAFKQNVYFSGTKGVMVVAGKALDVKGSELEKLKYESMLHFLTNLDSLGVKLQLDGTAVVNGKETYKVAVILLSGSKWIQYYDTQTWLKVKESKDIKVQQGTFTQDTYYSDYKDVNGINYPFTIKQNIGSQHIKFEVESIQVNTGLSDDLFKQN